MTIINQRTWSSRLASRRQSDRRLEERRQITHAFGSSKWIEDINKNYQVWPKEDRRTKDRRAQERRSDDRRNSRLGSSSAHIQSIINPTDDILSEEEKKMLHEMFKDKPAN